MEFFKQLFFKSEKKVQDSLSPDFDLKVRKAIKLLGEKENLHEDKDAIQFLIDNGIKEKEAVEIIIFLPIAFIRHWLTTVKWDDTYIEFVNENKTVERRRRILIKLFNQLKLHQLNFQIPTKSFRRFSVDYFLHSVKHSGFRVLR